MNLIKTIFFTAILSAVLSITALAQTNGSIAGTVTDVNGAIVQGATVTAVGPDGKEKIATTNKNGEFTINNLAAANYIVRVVAPNFALFENSEVAVTAGKKSELNVSLTIQAITDTVDVGSPNQVDTDPSNNASATVLSEKELEALPDDPDELEAALQALAGPGAGPNGGQIYIDGFTGGRLPPKEAIREIRINNNPFSAEFERLGFGRIEILTRPGSDKFRGNAFFNFNDESLNSRNPFSINRAPSQMRAYGGNFSGPIQKGKSSFFFDISERDNDSNAVVNAIILDSGLNPVIFQEEFTVPTRRFSFSPRVDFAINDKNTLVARYEYSHNTASNQGIGGTSLPSRAYESSNFEHEIRLTETMIVNAKTVNETRFSYDFSKREQVGDNTIPTISVGSEFTGGGAQVGNSFNRNKNWEFSNNTTTSFGKASQHAVKFGVRLRGVNIDDFSQSGFGGTFSFQGIPERHIPEGCTEGQPGCVVIPAVSALDQYRRLLAGEVNPDYNFHPTQFNITSGDPLATVSRTDVGAFITDDWRLRQGLTLSLGLRYENQTNIKSNLNFAPRVTIAWSPGAGGAKPPKTVFRAGAGIFYDRISEGLTLTANRFNGSNQRSFLINAFDTNAANQDIALALLAQPVFTLNGVSNVPTAAQIAAVLPGSSTIRKLDSDITAPYTMQAAFSVERQLPWRTTMSASYIISRSLHTLRLRNINAPICPEQLDCDGSPTPFGTPNPIFEYESGGSQNMQQLVVNFRSMINQNISLFGNYRLGFSKGDSDNQSYPAYTYDFTGEYGRSSGDVRNNFTIGGNISLPWEFSLSPFVTASSGRPFNIIRGVDLNGDTVLTERPTFAELGAKCSDLHLTKSWCDVSGQDPNAIIPRNWVEGPGSFSANLRVSKNFGFGGGGESNVASNQQGGTTTGGNSRGGGNRGGGNRGGGGGAARGGGGGFGGGPMMGGFGGGDRRKPYNLNLSISFQNLFNNVNWGTPVGNLASFRFGQSTSTGGSFGGFGGGGGGTANRRIDLQARFSW